MSSKIKQVNRAFTQYIQPKLRFPAFQDLGSWASGNLDSLYTFITTNCFSRDKLNYRKGAVRNIHYGDIHKKFSALFDIEKETVPFINESENIDKFKKDNFCIKGDIIFADASENVDDVGKSTEIVNLNNERLLAGLHTILARQKGKKLIVSFGGYLFQSNMIRDQIKKQAQGTKVFGISVGRLATIEICYPLENEQQKIADCLSSIDELITAESKKLDALKTYKKGLMQQLFPAEGETLPKFRFPEFQAAPDWEEKTLKELCSLQAGKFITASEIYEKNQKDLYSCYGGNGLRGFVKSYTHNGTHPLIGRQGALCGNINIGEGFFYATEHAVVVTAKKGVNVNWLFYQLVRLNLNQYATGQAQPGLSVTVLDKIYSIIPHSLIEQQKIADCLSSIDEFIAAESKKFEALKNHKKGLMQQLFPNMREL